MKTDYKNDILAESMNGLRRYEMINNDDGTVSFRDVSEYTQTGDGVTAGVMNEIGLHLNKIETFLPLQYEVADVSVPLLSVGAGKTYKTTVEIIPPSTYEAGKTYVPIFSSVKGTGSNNIYNYYQEIRTVKSGDLITGYELYSEWKNPSTTTVSSTAKVNILFAREY